jgi:predicted O-methyltransferase YrrM
MNDNESITNYLKNKNYTNFEGFVKNENQIIDLIQLSKYATNILEIGFNTGNSSDIFLKNNDKCNVVSFDIGYHEYVYSAKEYIDIYYPNRHTLIIGDSTKTVPQYYEKNKDIIFDLIFIDGGHEYDTARQDLMNCKLLSDKNTLIILDDVIRNSTLIAQYTRGPTLAWTECIYNNIVTELGYREYDYGTGMVYGKYII